MTRRTSFFALILGAVLSLALAACGATSNSPGSSGGIYGSSGSTPTTAASGQNSAQVATNTATVAGTSEPVLTNAQGMTLYYFKLDTAQTAACTATADSCTSFWPPLLDTSGTPTSSGSLPGKLAVLNDANGMQVTYNGHPLYTFSEDKAPGDTKGEGFMNEWHVATPTLAVLSTGGSTAPQPTATGGGYGYGGYGG